MLRGLYGSISQHLLFLNEFWFILTFSSLFWVIKGNKPSKTSKNVEKKFWKQLYICYIQTVFTKK